MGFTSDDYDVETDFAETGMVTCDDCGSRVRPATLASLPPHNCTQRRAQNEAIRLTDVGQRDKTEWVPARFRTGKEG